MAKAAALRFLFVQQECERELFSPFDSAAQPNPVKVFSLKVKGNSDDPSNLRLRVVRSTMDYNCPTIAQNLLHHVIHELFSIIRVKNFRRSIR